MPIFKYKCKDCGKIFEELITAGEDFVRCQGCSSRNLKKLLASFSVKMGAGPGPDPWEDGRHLVGMEADD